VSNKIEEHKNYLKILWEHLTFLGYTLRQRDRASIGLNVAEQTYHNLKEIANYFSTFFTTVASSLVHKLPPAPIIFAGKSPLFKQFYGKVTNNNLQLELIYLNQNFIYESINYSWDSTRGSELARVKPLFKKNSGIEIGNNKPVSIICIISKILEKDVYKQPETHLIHDNLSYKFQSGLRNSYSTDTCLIHLNDHIK